MTFLTPVVINACPLKFRTNDDLHSDILLLNSREDIYLLTFTCLELRRSYHTFREQELRQTLLRNVPSSGALFEFCLYKSMNSLLLNPTDRYYYILYILPYYSLLKEEEEVSFLPFLFSSSLQVLLDI